MSTMIKRTFVVCPHPSTVVNRRRVLGGTPCLFGRMGTAVVTTSSGATSGWKLQRCA